jgi:hypothetical protein
VLGDVDDAATGARSVTEDIGDLVYFDALLFATFLHCFFPVERVRSLCRAARALIEEPASRVWLTDFRSPMRIRGTRHQSARANRMAITVEVGLPPTTLAAASGPGKAGQQDTDADSRQVECIT